MIEETLINNLITMSRAAFFVYLLLAFLLGWILRNVFRRRFWHRFWEHEIQLDSQYTYPQQGHTYLEYVPEFRPKPVPQPLPLPLPQGGYQLYQHNPVRYQKETYVPPVPTEPVVKPENLPVENLQRDSNDLKVIEGIGPKIEALLKNAGIFSWQDLSETSASEVSEILKTSGKRFTMHDPTTWAHQAHMATTGKWGQLKSYQDFLNGGRE